METGNLLFVEAYRRSAQGDPGGALELVAQSVLDGQVSDAEAALLLNNVGAAHLKRKRHETAVEFLSKAIEVKRRLGEPHSLGLSLANLGFVQIELREFIEGTRLIIEGATLIASSHRPETNAQLVNNFWGVSVRMAPEPQRERMQQMWSDAGLHNLSWPATSVQLG